MQKVRPGQSEIKKFLVGAVIDPNKKDNFVENQLVEIGEPPYYEVRVVEFMGEAKRLRERMKGASGSKLATLVEEYVLTLTKAATNLAIAAGKVQETNEPRPAKATARPRGKDPGGDRTVPPSEGMGGP
jgi:hypothetical protein